MHPSQASLNTITPLESNEWEQQLRNSYSTLDQLVQNHLISASEALSLRSVAKSFKIRVTPYYASLMSLDPECPIRRQILPDLGEQDPELPDEIKQLSQEIYQRPTPWLGDSIGDLQNLAAPRLTHRYSNRAILHLSSMCAVDCRFCFRKSHLNQRETSLYSGRLEPAFEYLKNHSEIRELILTGGDPLSLGDANLESLLIKISQISTIRTLRIHSRMPVTLPHRLTSSLIQKLSEDRGFQVVLASHFNHPLELTELARQKLNALKRAGITVLNQTVLLKGVNAQVECLATLFQELYELGVIPFYLHHPDWTPGTFHFRVSLEAGKSLVTQLRGLLPGPAIPHYVLDIPQGHGKTPILDPHFKKIQDLSFSQANQTLNSFPAPGSSALDRTRGLPIGGALYEVTAPETRFKKQPPRRYLDLFFTA